MKTINKKQIFTAAWATAKQAAAEFGGRAVSYLSESLKMSWAEARHPKRDIADSMVALGGKLWEAGDKRRVYFNVDAICELIGLETSKYKTGNIKSAILDGESISNSKASKLIRELDCMGLYYDLAKNDYGYKYSSDAVDTVIEKINSSI